MQEAQVTIIGTSLKIFFHYDERSKKKQGENRGREKQCQSSNSKVQINFKCQNLEKSLSFGF